MERSDDVEQEMEREGEAMEQELDRLEQHIDEAKAKAPDAVPGDGGEVETLDGVAGDVTDEEGGPMFGEDAKGAVETRGEQTR